MNTLVCYKIVYEEQDIRINPDQTLAFDKAEVKLSLYDLNAAEEAAAIAEKTDGTVKALTVGDSKVENSKLKKSILSRGPQELYTVADDGLTYADAHQTAQVIAAAADKIGFDLILCGEGSADMYAQQTGIQLGSLLKVPVINAVSRITAGEGYIEVERTLEDSVEVLEIKLPAVVCVTSDINTPILPSMKDILAAGKKPATAWKLSDIGISMPEPTIETDSILAPKATDRKKVIFEGDDKVAELFEKIKAL